MSFAKYAMSLSMLCLAAALVYFSWQLGNLIVYLNVEQDGGRVESLFDHLDTLERLVPPVLEESAAVRQQVSEVVNESRQLREALPLVLEESRAIRGQLPPVIETVNKTNEAVILAVDEIKQVRPLVPQILSEVRLTREQIPPALDRAEGLVSNLKKAGKEASKGAVTGVISGIITAPFELVGSLGKALFAFSDEELSQVSKQDLEIITTAFDQVLQSDQAGYSRQWKNPESGAQGVVTLHKLQTTDGKLCKIVHSRVTTADGKLIEKDITACQDENGRWKRND